MSIKDSFFLESLTRQIGSYVAVGVDQSPCVTLTSESLGTLRKH